jgi:cellulose synthase/poly-beta-1,6-N-acetylglucosamine synthase-like glycosyltransferase
VVQETYENQPLIRLIKKPNGGKSSAVNLGFKEANGEIVVALDADTLIADNAISLLVSHFKDENVAAVSGNVKVGNKGNLLTNWQHIEYVTGFNLERRAFAILNCITVVPGAIGAWKKTAVEEAGYFQEDTLAEDTDITLTLLCNGKKIEFEEKAYAYTEVPEDINSLAKQRYRWVYGTLQCLWKHRRALFNKKHKSLGYIGLPNMWLFQYFYQTISPIADILFIIALFSPHPEKAAIGFILFYLLDFFTALYAFRLEKESPKPLGSLFLQRILYKQLMTYIVIKSILSAVMGVTVGWNKLTRNGNVTQETSITKVNESA